MGTITSILHNWLKSNKGAIPDLYLVGGAVRDHLLSRPVDDIDLVCHEPEAFAAGLAESMNATVVPFLKKADVPCYRVVNRSNTDDHLDLAPIHDGSIEADLARRDFTINAMAFKILSDGGLGRLIDPFNGRGDLADGIIRATKPNVLHDDPLRLVRAVRFSNQLEFKIENRTLAYMQSAANGLGHVAGERIRVELEKMLVFPGCGRQFRVLDDLGILAVILPEIVPMKDCAQNEHHHLDVWQHCLAVLEKCEDIVHNPEACFGGMAPQVKQGLETGGRGGLLKFAALLHDCGKPASRAVDENSGKTTFYGHDRIGAEMAVDICNRLRFSKRGSEFVRLMVANHLHALFWSRPEVRTKTLMKWFRKLGDEMVPLIILSMADSRATLGTASDAGSRARHEAWAVQTVRDYYTNLKPELARRSLINGDDLIAMGVRPGPGLGKILKRVRKAQDETHVNDRTQALAFAHELMAGDLMGEQGD